MSFWIDFGNHFGGQNRLKILENWVLRAKMVLGGLQARARPDYRVPEGRFWAPPGIPKSTQNWTLDRKLKSRIDGFIDSCRECRWCYRFHQFLIDFWAKKWCFFLRFLVCILAFCSTCRPSRNTVIYISKATFSFFKTSLFLEKIAPKYNKKTTSRKYTENNLPGTIFGRQNG